MGNFATTFGPPCRRFWIRDFDVKHGQRDPAFIFREIARRTSHESREEEDITEKVE